MTTFVHTYVLEKIEGLNIAMGYGLDGPVQFPPVQDFSFLHSVQMGSKTHQASNSVGTGCPFLGVKWQWREADNLPRLRIVKQYTSTRPYVFMAYCLTNFLFKRLCPRKTLICLKTKILEQYSISTTPQKMTLYNLKNTSRCGCPCEIKNC
jgi:hypothetical protein